MKKSKNEEHIKMMKIAIQMAHRGLNWTSPNPKVGAVITKYGEVIAKAYHQRFGEPHAEVNVFSQCKEELEKATLYVTLEPCSTYGKTPPCTETILKSGIRHVVMGCLDPNPVHQGKGVKLLRHHGIHVETGVMEKECRELIKPFEKWIEKKIPYCIVKAAMSLDGKIATFSGQSKWITGKEAREQGYLLRSKVDGIVVGIHTVLKDNPELTLHRFKGKEPFKIVLDSRARISLKSNLIKKNAKQVILAVSRSARISKTNKLRKKGVRVIKIDTKNGNICLSKLFKVLGEMGIASLLVEGGGRVIASVFKEKLADQICFFYSPILIGGEKAPTAFEGNGVQKLQSAIRIENSKIHRYGKDFMIAGDVRY